MSKNKSKSFTTFSINGTSWAFSIQKFNALFEERRRKESKSQDQRVSNNQLYESIAESVHVSPDSVRNWKKGVNGPSEPCLNLLAQFFEVEKIDLLKPQSSSDDLFTREADRAEVNRVFTGCLDALFIITHFTPEDGKGTRKQQEAENTQAAVNAVHSLDQSVYSHSLLISTNISYRLHRLLKDMEYIAQERIRDIPWDNVPDEVEEYECEVMNFQFFLYNNKRDIIEESPTIEGRCYLFDEIEYADDLDLDNIVEPDDYFDEHDEDAEVLMKYGYQGDLEISPTMVYDHILTKYMTAVFRWQFPEVFED